MKLTKELVLSDISALPKGYKTAAVDVLIRKYIKAGADVSDLREYVLEHRYLHRIYYFVSLKQIKSPTERMKFIHENLIFNDWWHTDQLIKFIRDLDFDTAFNYAREYVKSEDPYIRRWGYVMFISKLGRSSEKNLEKMLSLLKNDAHYTNQMAQGWLICELAIFFPERILEWFKISNNLDYRINSKAIQKISDSFRIKECVKEEFKALRPMLKNKGETK